MTGFVKTSDSNVAADIKDRINSKYRYKNDGVTVGRTSTISAGGFFYVYVSDQDMQFLTDAEKSAMVTEIEE